MKKTFVCLTTQASASSFYVSSVFQGARDLARPPTLSEIVHSILENAKTKEESKEGEEKEKDETEERKTGLKRKLDSQECYEDQQYDSHKEDDKSPKELGKLTRAKNLAISMASKAASMARELKSIKSDLCFMQERCALFEEENRRLRDAFDKGMRPEEDDLVRLQMEVLLAEKSRLANENANLTRENQCLHQLVEYHQLTSQDLSASFEHVIRGMCLDFSSSPPIPEEDGEEDGNETSITPRRDLFGVSNSWEEFCSEDQQEMKDR